MGGIVPLTRAPAHRTRLSCVPKTNRDTSLNTSFCQSVTFHFGLACNHCRRSCRCSKGLHGRALGFKICFCKGSEIVCGTLATPTSARIVERVTVGFTSACHTILRPFLLVVFLVAPDPVCNDVGTFSCPLLPTISNGPSERSTWPAIRCVDEPEIFILMIRPL
ncbi:uncharacterized protein TNCV_204541 [Trichonephila clavipes]|nr:uncharacterized protein TNCV_204541 [Trichonephila clavipes]